MPSEIKTIKVGEISEKGLEEKNFKVKKLISNISKAPIILSKKNFMKHENFLNIAKNSAVISENTFVLKKNGFSKLIYGSNVSKLSNISGGKIIFSWVALVISTFIETFQKLEATTNINNSNNSIIQKTNNFFTETSINIKQNIKLYYKQDLLLLRVSLFLFYNQNLIREQITVIWNFVRQFLQINGLLK
jgi:hypothetical protein